MTKTFKHKNHAQKEGKLTLAKVKREIGKIKREMEIPVHKLNKGLGTMFPPRLRVHGKMEVSVSAAFSSVATIHNLFNLSNPINLYPAAAQNVSGLAWLISGQQTNGTSYAPYGTGIVRWVDFKCQIKTIQASAGSTGGQAVIYPLGPNQTTSTLNVSQALEHFGRSNECAMPDTVDSISYSKPQIRHKYKLWNLFGISEEVYMNTPTLYGFNYSGALSQIVYADLIYQTENNTTDSAYQCRSDITLTIEMDLFYRNDLIGVAPRP